MKLINGGLGSEFTLHDSFVCAGGKATEDTCVGDGGSPLVCNYNKNRAIQVGIVSWGVGHDCGLDGIPGVYVNVAKFEDWIRKTLASKGINV